MNLTNTLTINLPVGTANKIMIGDQPQLRGKKVRAVLTRIRKEASDKSSQGVELAANQANAFLSLVTSSGETVHDSIPFTLLDPTLNNGTIREFTPAPIDWTKSVVTYAGISGTDNGKQITLVVLYE